MMSAEEALRSGSLWAWAIFYDDPRDEDLDTSHLPSVDELRQQKKEQRQAKANRLASKEAAR